MSFPMRPAPSRSFSPRQRARGFTLVETMVALTIGLVILLAVSVMYARNSSNFSEIEKTGDLLENARYALDVISEDLQQAGFYAEINPASLSIQWQNSATPCETNTGNLGWDTTNAVIKMPPAVLGTPSTSSLSCFSNPNPPQLSGTPALTVRHAATDATTTIANVTAGNLYLQVSRCYTDTRSIVASATSSDFTLKNIGCTAAINELRRFQVRTYYLASCSTCSPSDNLPTLVRAELINNALRFTPIAEGIEKLAFEYGVDSNGDGQPDEFIDASLMGASPRLWENVVSVRVTLLARARNTTANYTDARTYTIAGTAYTPADGYKRTLLTSTVRLVNVGGRLEQ